MKKFTIKPQSFFKVLGGTSHSQVAEMVLKAGESTGGSDNKHEKSDQWLYVVSGSGQAIIDGKSEEINSGDLLLIEAGENHQIKNTGNTLLRTFNIYAPPEY
jgi:mannose-6-phosphate isomerase-like protein (cupin superfamily)